jgi:hypothetical protein
MRRRRHRRGLRAARANGPLRWLLPVVFGVLATLATSAVRQEATARYADIDACVGGCSVAAGGWPLPWLIDYPGLSPGGSVSLAGAVLGVDRWRPEAFAIDAVLWTVLAAIVLAAGRRLRR